MQLHELKKVLFITCNTLHYFWRRLCSIFHEVSWFFEGAETRFSFMEQCHMLTVMNVA